MSFEEYLNLTDEEIQFLIAYDYGIRPGSPWHGSVLGKVHAKDDLDGQEEVSEEEAPEMVQLDEITAEEKSTDLDAPREPD